MANFTASPQMICPHCQMKGKISTRATKIKTGIGGGKVIAGILTLGVSTITPGIGLSNKQKVTEAKCGNCGASWNF